MTFFVYDESTSHLFDLMTQKQLNSLQKRFGTVEVRELPNEKKWSVRIATIGTDKKRLPMAAIGNNVYEAAERLIRIAADHDHEHE